MYRPLLIICVCVLWPAVSHCNTLILQPTNFLPDAHSYAWIIPPRLQLQPTIHEPLQGASSSDVQNQSPPPPLRGCGHPSFIRRHSQEQLQLPNEFLVATGGDPQRASPPLFVQLDPVNCEGATGPSPDCTPQQQRPTRQHQSNLPAVPVVAHQQSVPVSWPSNHQQHGGGIGLLFFVPDSASHLPVEQLIRQHLALHRTQLPFDISMNCQDSEAPGCFGGGGRGGVQSSPTTETTFNGEHVENVNYASLPLVKNVNSRTDNQQGHRWRTIGELLAQQQQQQHHRQLSILPL